MKSGRYFMLNVIGMVVVVVIIIVAVMISANIYTKHGEAIAVPNVCEKTMADAKHVIEAEGLFVVVADTGYNRNLPPDYVLHQQPSPGTKVKGGRTVYLTINSLKRPTVVMPDIIDNSSVREATARLKILGFKVGTPQYIDGEKDWVYGVLCRGKQVQAGERVSVDATIILQVGNGEGSEFDDLQYIDPNLEFEFNETEGTEFEDAPSATTEPEEDPFVIIE